MGKWDERLEERKCACACSCGMMFRCLKTSLQKYASRSHDPYLKNIRGQLSSVLSIKEAKRILKGLENEYYPKGSEE